MTPALTTIRQPRTLIGKHAMALLLELLSTAARPRTEIFLRPDLVVRNSVILTVRTMGLRRLQLLPPLQPVETRSSASKILEGSAALSRARSSNADQRHRQPHQDSRGQRLGKQRPSPQHGDRRTEIDRSADLGHREETQARVVDRIGGKVANRTSQTIPTPKAASTAGRGFLAS